MLGPLDVGVPATAAVPTKLGAEGPAEATRVGKMMVGPVAGVTAVATVGGAVEGAAGARGAAAGTGGVTKTKTSDSDSVVL